MAINTSVLLLLVHFDIVRSSLLLSLLDLHFGLVATINTSVLLLLVHFDIVVACSSYTYNFAVPLVEDVLNHALAARRPVAVAVSDDAGRQRQHRQEHTHAASDRSAWEERQEDERQTTDSLNRPAPTAPK